MSSLHALCCLLSVKKQTHDFFFVQCIIKRLDSVFVISRIIKVSVRVISLGLQLRLITLTLILIILNITKTSSNNCLTLGHWSKGGGGEGFVVWFATQQGVGYCHAALCRECNFMQVCPEQGLILLNRKDLNDCHHHRHGSRFL